MARRWSTPSMSRTCSAEAARQARQQGAGTQAARGDRARRRTGAAGMKPDPPDPGFLTVGLWTLVSRVAGLCARRDDRGLSGRRAGGRGVPGRLLAAQHVPPLLRRRRVQHGLRADVRQAAGSGRGPRRALRARRSGCRRCWWCSRCWHAGDAVAGAGDGGGLCGDERFDLAVLYGRIAFPYILFISLVALLSGVLNAHRAGSPRRRRCRSC
jgi:putative peptidoglycan lipid II flippase